jgi:hypothetical protein
MKKILMFVMVMAISTTALATIEDLAPPQWRRAQPAAILVYQFEEDGDYEGGNAEPSCLSGSDDFTLEAPDGSWADGELTTEGDTFFSVAIPEGAGENITIRVQAIIPSGSPSEFIVDLRDDGFDFLDEVIAFSPEVNPLADDLYVHQGTMAYHPDAFFAGVSIIGGNNVFEGVIVDVLVHDGDAPDIGHRVSECFKLSAITIDSNDLPVYEPFDPCEPGFPGGPPVVGPTEGQLLVSLTWKPGDPCYPAFNAMVTVDPNIEGDGPHEDFVFPASTADDGSVTLGFTDANWSDPQSVIVQAVKDLDREGDEEYFVELTVTIDIADSNFSNVEDQASVSIVDNDIPVVVALPPAIIGQLSENEPFVPYCFDVTLSHQPTDDVYVIVFRESEYDIVLESMSVMDPNFEDWTDPNRMKFTPGNWNVGQTICLKALDDDERGEGPEGEGLEWVPGVVILTPYSEDPRYSVDWLLPDQYGFPLDLGEGGNPDAVAEETFVDFNVQDNECGAVGYAAVDYNEDCLVNLADFVDFYIQWLYCTQPYDDASECDKSWILVPSE